MGVEAPKSLIWANLDTPTTQEWGILLGVPEQFAVWWLFWWSKVLEVLEACKLQRHYPQHWETTDLCWDGRNSNVTQYSKLTQGWLEIRIFLVAQEWVMWVCDHEVLIRYLYIQHKGDAWYPLSCLRRGSAAGIMVQQGNSEVDRSPSHNRRLLFSLSQYYYFIQVSRWLFIEILEGIQGNCSMGKCLLWKN